MKPDVGHPGAGRGKPQRGRQPRKHAKLTEGEAFVRDGAAPEVFRDPTVGDAEQAEPREPQGPSRGRVAQELSGACPFLSSANGADAGRLSCEGPVLGPVPMCASLASVA